MTTPKPPNHEKSRASPAKKTPKDREDVKYQGSLFDKLCLWNPKYVYSIQYTYVEVEVSKEGR